MERSPRCWRGLGNRSMRRICWSCWCRALGAKPRLALEIPEVDQLFPVLDIGARSVVPADLTEIFIHLGAAGGVESFEFAVVICVVLLVAVKLFLADGAPRVAGAPRAHIGDIHLGL